MYRYLIIIEPGEHNYSAYVPDLPGCITTGATYEEVQKNMREAIALHLQGVFHAARISTMLASKNTCPICLNVPNFPNQPTTFKNYVSHVSQCPNQPLP